MEEWQCEPENRLKFTLQSVYRGSFFIWHLLINLKTKSNGGAGSRNGYTSFSPKEKTGTRSALNYASQNKYRKSQRLVHTHTE